MRLIVSLLALFLMAIPAAALDFNQEIKDGEGQVIEVDKKPLTLGRAAATALFANLPGDDKASAEEKFKRGMLALKVRGGGDLAVTAEEIALMKKAVAAAYGPLIVARVWPMLDAAEVAPPQDGAPKP